MNLYTNLVLFQIQYKYNKKLEKFFQKLKFFQRTFLCGE